MSEKYLVRILKDSGGMHLSIPEDLSQIFGDTNSISYAQISRRFGGIYLQPVKAAELIKK